VPLEIGEEKGIRTSLVSATEKGNLAEPGPRPLSLPESQSREKRAERKKSSMGRKAQVDAGKVGKTGVAHRGGKPCRPGLKKGKGESNAWKTKWPKGHAAVQRSIYLPVKKRKNGKEKKRVTNGRCCSSGIGGKMDNITMGKKKPSAQPRGEHS